ncbi:MAG: formate dehydrogenase [Betaproteobacteria bacterium]
MTTTLRALIAAGVVVASFGLAVAKLPPPDEAAKAAAEQKKEKDAATGKKAAADLAKAQDRVAAKYIAEERAKGKTVTPQMGPTPAAGSDAGKGLSSQPEKAAAHSPAKK